MTHPTLIQNVPCTLVTGFLGAGKTTLINQLLSTKAITERWALLINEFGRIGIDGALLRDGQTDAGNTTNHANIAIREVSGGCICCTSQLPLQIALTRLLTEHRPQRLIIEPTGLAHPHELLTQLSAPHWQTALSMQAVITVLSATQWQQEKHRHHEGFQEHVRTADVVVINRYESLHNRDRQDLQHWLIELNPQASLIWMTSQTVGDVIENTIIENTTIKNTATNTTSSLLSQLSAQLSQPSHRLTQHRGAARAQIRLTPPQRLAPTTSMLINKTNNDNEIAVNNELPYRYHDKQQGMLVAGWKLPPQWIFDADKLQSWLLNLPNWQRIKGVVHTTQSWLQLNFTPDSLTTMDTSAQIDNRLEVILLDDNSAKSANHPPINWEALDGELMALIVK